ncbi:unnamed protein product, partial [Rotaria sp. Silwood1]
MSNNTSYSNPIPAIIVIFASESTGGLYQRRLLYKNVFLPTNLKAHGPTQSYAFIRMFESYSKSFYYMIVIPDRRLYSILNTSVISSNLCRNISEVFNNEIILFEYSYLKRLKLYPLPCKNDSDLRCFFDEYRMCLCAKDRNSACFIFNHEQSNCDYCENNGLCLRKDPNENQWEFICLCPECSFGILCQFLIGSYFTTLDLL